jgi:hypothetical protein
MRARLVTLFVPWAVALAACPSSPGMLDVLPPPDTTGPTVISTDPPADASWADADLTVTIEFDEPIRASSLPGNLSVTLDGAPVPGTVSAGETSCTFAPEGGFAYGRTYEVMLSDGILDLAGNGIVPHTFRFTTQAVPTRPTGLVSVSPLERGSDVDPGTTLTARFAEDVDLATVTSANVQVTHGGVPVPGVLSYEAPSRTISFTPMPALAFGEQYTVLLGAGLRTAGGATPLPSGYRWTFTMRRIVGAAVRVTAATASFDAPIVAGDANGNVTVVWAQWDGTPSTVYGATYDVYAARRVAGTWSAPQVVANLDPGTADQLHLACAPAGECLVVWRQHQPGAPSSRVYASRFAPEVGWGIPVALDADPTVDDRLAVAGAPDGNVIVVWVSGGALFANRFVPSAGWSGAAVVPWTPSECWPAVAVAASGRAVVVSAVYDAAPGAPDAIAAHFTPGAGWSGPEAISTSPTSVGGYAAAAIDGEGRVLAAWVEQDGTKASRFDPGTGWSAATTISANGGRPLLGMDGGGRALLAFASATPWAAHFDPVLGWGPVTQLAPWMDEDGVASAVAPNGGAAVAWTGRPTVWVNIAYHWVRRRTAAGTWLPAVAVAVRRYRYEVGIGTAGAGEILASWWDDEGVWVASLP